MKKNLTLLILFFVLGAFSLNVSAKTAKWKKSYRFGVRGGLYTPNTKIDNLSYGDAVGGDIEFQFNAIIHENVDSGPHFGIFFRRVKNASTGEASDYWIVPMTFNFRFYPFSRSRNTSTHGWFQPYFGAGIGYYFSLLANTNKLSTSTGSIIVPDGLGGLGIQGKVGIELTSLGIISIPDFRWFVEVAYRKGDLVSQRGYKLSLDGLTFSLGMRL